MSAQAEMPQNPCGRPKPSPSERRWSRVQRLRLLGANDLQGKVCHALFAEWTEGRKPDRVLIRRTFARHARPFTDEYSDRKLPPASARPPATRLIAKTGSALELYLTILFVSQCTTAPGGVPDNHRLVVPQTTDRSGLRPWADLVAAPSERRPSGRRTYVTTEENRIRQLGGTLKRLAQAGLVDFPNQWAPKKKYEGFKVLLESGDTSRASRVIYAVPSSAEDVLGLPAAFFTRGWHLALSDSEIAMLLTLYAHRGAATPWPQELLVMLDGETRIRHHALSPDAYATHKYLSKYGVLDVSADERRRIDGTYEHFARDERPLPHSFRVLESGFERDAVPTVMATLQGMGTTPPARSGP
jgi:hypothetical protein